MALSKAIAANYNDVKHAKRGPMPPSAHTYAAGKVALLIVRLLSLRLLDPSLAVVHAYGKDWKFREMKDQIVHLNVYVNRDGKFVAREGEKDLAKADISAP